MGQTARQMAEEKFKVGDRAKDSTGREGVIKSVNVHAAAVVDIQFDGTVSLMPFLFFDLEKVPAPVAWQCETCGWTCGPTVCDNPECDNCGDELVPAHMSDFSKEA